jgi:hypothetical protein
MRSVVTGLRPLAYLLRICQPGQLLLLKNSSIYAYVCATRRLQTLFSAVLVQSQHVMLPFVD